MLVDLRLMIRTYIINRLITRTGFTFIKINVVIVKRHYRSYERTFETASEIPIQNILFLCSNVAEEFIQQSHIRIAYFLNVKLSKEINT